MNKFTKRIGCILLTVLLTALAVGCAKEEPAETTVVTTVETTEPVLIIEDFGAGMLVTDEGLEAIFGKQEETTEATEEVTEPTETSSKDNSNTTSTTKPTTGSSSNQNSGSSTKETKPKETEPRETEPEETTAPTTQDKPDETQPAVVLSDYEKYNAMSGTEQMEFMQSFESVEAFFNWYNNAKAEYEAAHPDLEIGDGKIDLGDIG